MAKKTSPNSLTISEKPGQVSAPGGPLSNFLVRNLPIWANPQWLNSNQWREFVRKQPIAVLCREAISNHLLSLDWAIVARDPNQQDELKEDIKYYTKLLERANAYYSELDFTSHIEFIVKDLFDLPFGTAGEIGRENDSPEGKVVWVRPLDAGTLSPTLNSDYPVAQLYPGYDPVVFPKEYISRIYLSPRTEIQREGWGMAPPERIYLAMEMVSRGDVYYSQLLLNTPEAGILDLMDMEKTAAEEWVKSFKDLLFGINALKIPVLYEHTTAAKWIPFGKNPADIMYDTVTSRYINVICAGYGLTASDIGFPSSSNGGETLAGTIRQERSSARSGKSLAKKKTKAYFDVILPPELMFRWIDYDDEKQVALSRARMADGNAFGTFIANQIFTPDELRRQALADGLITISVPETIDRKTVEWPSRQLTYVGNKQKGSNEVGNPKSPSGGGQGEVKPQQVIQRNRAKFEVSVSKAVYGGNQILGALINSVRKGDMNDFPTWEKKFDDAVIGKSMADLMTESVIDDTYNYILDVLERADWVDTVSREIANDIIENRSKYIFSIKESEITKRAEQEYIEGTRLDILPSDSEMEFLSKFSEELRSKYSEFENDVRTEVLQSLIPKIISVSKSSILEYKFDIDTTDFTDNNTIKLARDVASKVFQLFPKTVEDVYVRLNKKLDEGEI